MTEKPLARLFAAVWDAFIEGGHLDGFEIEKLVEKTGLAEWRDATEDDVKSNAAEIEVGDPILCLTEEGRRIVREGREP